MQKNNNTPVIDAAIQWWVDHITNPHYGDAQNGQLEGFASILTTFARLTANQNTNTSPEKIEIFKASLRTDLERKSQFGEAIISTDWAPEGSLSDACVKSGIPGTTFPMKAMMWVNFTAQTVKICISAGPTKQVYPALALTA